MSLLYEDKAEYSAVCNIFKEDINQTDNNIQVVLNKYMNALRVFGIKVVKNKNKFVMENSLYSLPFSLADLKSINLLSASCKDFPDNDTIQSVEKFLQNILIRMSNEDKNKMNNIFNKYDFSFYYSDLRSQIEQCEKVCKEKFVVDIIYINKKQEYKCRCNPKEVLYESKQAYFEVYDINKKEKLEIPISNILSLVILPQKTNPAELSTTVVFKVKGPLAKNYKLKANEYSNGFDKDGSQIIVNKNEPFDKLFARLIRYGTKCEIMTPKFLRNDFIKLIDDMLDKYNI